MCSAREAIVVGPAAGVIVALVLAVWPWTRTRFRSAVIGLATVPGAVAWNLALWNANATNMDVDGSILRLSFQDVGSGVCAFSTVALVLGLGSERGESADRVVAAAAIARLVTLFLDLYV